MLFDQPRKIYRYLRFSAKTVESLCHDQLHFADPTAFNDPLDCQPTVEANSDMDELRRLLAEQIKRRVEAETLASMKNARLKGNNAALHAKRLGEQAARSELANIAYHATNPDYECSEIEAERWLLTNEIQRELLKRYDRGVCCFSSTVDNPLLWSHYGDQHRGVCIGYGLNREPKPKLHKVLYGGSRTVETSLIANALLKKDPDSQELLDRNVLLRKASPWRYEREWRLLGDRGVQESCLAMKDVTFGLRCPAAVIHSVIAALESREDTVKFYQMSEVEGSFKLKRKPVELYEGPPLFPHTARSGLEIFGPIIEK